MERVRGPLSRGVILLIAQPLFPPLQKDLRSLLRPPSHTRRPIGLPYGSLSQRETYGLTTFRASTFCMV